MSDQDSVTMFDDLRNDLHALEHKLSSAERHYRSLMYQMLNLKNNFKKYSWN